MPTKHGAHGSNFIRRYWPTVAVPVLFVSTFSFINCRESQCSDGFHKPVLVGATPSPASNFMGL